MNRKSTPFTAHWLGCCPVKGCNCRLHIDVPMMRENWTEKHYDHAMGNYREVFKTRDITDPSFGYGFTPHNLMLHCARHKYQLNWRPVNGVYSADHVCDSRCMNAIGSNCECGCGGQNHGRGYHVELRWKSEPVAVGN